MTVRCSVPNFQNYLTGCSFEGSLARISLQMFGVRGLHQPPTAGHYQRGQQATISTEHFEMKADFQCPGCDTGTRFDFLFRTSAPRPEFGCLPIFKINLAMFEVRRPSSARIHWEFGVRGRRPIRLILAIFQSSVGQCKSF